MFLGFDPENYCVRYDVQRQSDKRLICPLLLGKLYYNEEEKKKTNETACQLNGLHVAERNSYPSETVRSYCCMCTNKYNFRKILFEDTII